MQAIVIVLIRVARKVFVVNVLSITRSWVNCLPVIFQTMRKEHMTVRSNILLDSIRKEDPGFK